MHDTREQWLEDRKQWEKDREQWLKDTEEYFRKAQSYNATIITVGYATFFGLLAFLHEKTNNQLVYWACLAVAISAGIFVLYEIIENIKLALQTRNLGKENSRFFKYWAWFFIPSLLLGTFGVGVLVWLLFCNL